MDRRQARTRVLIALTLPLLLAAAADTPRLPIKETRWLAPEQLFYGLTRQPAECFVPPRALAERKSAAIGRAAFRAPLLLGGQAARAGLSCASCHRNGRGNPHFTFPSVSGHPGTADVTSSLMSSKRGDRTFNPRVIPDLARTSKISRDPRSAELKTFIRGLIVEEFDGPEPPASVLDGLTAYVSALSQASCRGNEVVPIRLDTMLADADGAMRAAEDSWRSGDRASARLLVGAARSTLGLIDERFQLRGLERSRAQLRAADDWLRAIQHAIASPTAATEFRKWRGDWRRRSRELRKQEHLSLFSPPVLRRALAGG